MAVYTDITDSELAAFLADYDLGTLHAFKGIAEGVENSNFLVETDRARLILTLYERRVAETDLPFFIGLMSHLAQNGFPSPVPQTDRQGRNLKHLRDRPAALVSFLDGFSVREPLEVHCRQAGYGLAQLHLAAQSFSMSRTNSLGLAAWRPLFAPHAQAAEGLEQGLSARVSNDLDDLAKTWPSGLPEGVIHADLFPDNVFFLEDRFVAAIDFYFACSDMLAYDLAICLNAWCHDATGRLDLVRARAMVEGYQSLRTLSDSEVAALPALARGAAMRFFLTRLADWGAARPGALVRPKDPLEYARKLDFHRAHHAAPAAYGL